MSRIVSCCSLSLSDYYSGVVHRFGEITEGSFVPFTSFQLCPYSCCCLVSVPTQLEIASGLNVALIFTVNSWFIIGKTGSRGWKKVNTKFNSAHIGTPDNRDDYVVKNFFGSACLRYVLMEL